MKPIVKVKDLVFDYMTKRALYGISFEIEKGSIVALIGPNGAGKTTLMRCLAGLVQPFSGEIFVSGVNVPENSRQAHKYISYLSDVFGLYDTLTARQCLTYAALAFDIPENKIKSRINETAEMLNLTDHLDAYAGSLSRGLRQRLAIAQSIIHEPKFIILDEPASGLDPEARIELSKLFIDLKNKGHTLMISSHILAELQDYATHVMVLKGGYLVKSEDFKGVSKNKKGTPYIPIAIRIKSRKDELLRFLENRPDVSDVSFDGAVARGIFFGKEDALSGLLKALVTENFPILEFMTEKSSLKTAYFETL